MARNHNDHLPSAHQGQTNRTHGMQQGGNTYDVKHLPRLFGDLIGRRIGTALGGNRSFGCLVRHATADEFQVEILVQRNFTDPDYNLEIPLRTSGVIVITMKYEGRLDGIDRFVLKEIESRTWTVGLNNNGDIIRQLEQCPDYDIGIFGVSEETLRRDYGKFFRVEDAAAVDSQHHKRDAPSDGLGIPCLCP